MIESILSPEEELKVLTIGYAPPDISWKFFPNSDMIFNNLEQMDDESITHVAMGVIASKFCYYSYKKEILDGFLELITKLEVSKGLNLLEIVMHAANDQVKNMLFQSKVNASWIKENQAYLHKRIMERTEEDSKIILGKVKSYVVRSNLGAEYWSKTNLDERFVKDPRFFIADPVSA
jgi:hypothetical protein